MWLHEQCTEARKAGKQMADAVVHEEDASVARQRALKRKVSLGATSPGEDALCAKKQSIDGSALAKGGDEEKKEENEEDPDEEESEEEEQGNKDPVVSEENTAGVAAASASGNVDALELMEAEQLGAAEGGKRPGPLRAAAGGEGEEAVVAGG